MRFLRVAQDTRVGLSTSANAAFGLLLTTALTSRATRAIDAG